MMRRRLILCDVFTSIALKGNGLAVVFDSDSLSSCQMQAFAGWINQAETGFLGSPTDRDADYKVRIFTPNRELSFAGHPTLGSCAAWLMSGGVPQNAGLVRQECGIGIIEIDVSGKVPAFVAPATKIGALPEDQLSDIIKKLGIDRTAVRASAQLDNGPVWQVLELTLAVDVLAVDAERVKGFNAAIGLIGAHPEGLDCQYEIRMLSSSAIRNEDPITGSLIAALGKWLDDAGRLLSPITIAQGTTLGRVGRAYICPDPDRAGRILIGGHTQIISDGTVEL